MNFKNKITFLFLLIFIFPLGLSSIDTEKLNQKIKKWEIKNDNPAIILISNPLSGKLEFAFKEEEAYNRKLPPGSIVKTLSAFVLLGYPNVFLNFLKEEYICNGKFEEPHSNYFTQENKKNYNLIEIPDSNRMYFKCSTKKGHGKMTLYTALAHSCNSFFLHMAASNPEFFYERLVGDWKLDLDTEFFLVKSQKKRILNSNQVSKFTLALSSIGEANVQVSAMEIAQIYGAIFAETSILKPIRKGEIPEELYPFPYSSIDRKKIKHSLGLTVKEGTLKNLVIKNNNIRILGGKTGSPTQIGKKYSTHGWNIIYFIKADIPYLLVVFTEKGPSTKHTLELSKIILNTI